MASEKSHEAVGAVTAGVEAVGLSEDAGQNLKLDQATFFRCVENGNLSALSGLLKSQRVDINAYNDEVRAHSRFYGIRIALGLSFILVEVVLELLCNLKHLTLIFLLVLFMVDRIRNGDSLLELEGNSLRRDECFGSCVLGGAGHVLK